ncbi:MAG: hypothetical protein JNL78_05585 [Rhodocyclaceae bacterium]|nr:hypothetical protein [Rhodocyclaceae bacterium]
MTNEARATLLSKLQHKWLLLINLAIGAFVSLTNGGALLLVQAGRGGPITSAQIPEMLVLLTVGVFLLTMSVAGYLGLVQLINVLRIQSAAILCLVVALGAWGITLLLSGTERAHVRWVVGYYSVFSVYAALLVLRVVESAGTRQIVQRVLWLIIPTAVILDLLVAFRG